MHITSLPSDFGIGDLGPEAYRFVDFLAEAGQTYWQILPLSPTSPIMGNSPYSSDSAFAGNPLLISPEKMVQHGWLTSKEIADYHPRHNLGAAVADYEGAKAFKEGLLKMAFRRSAYKLAEKSEFIIFEQNHPWLDDYALFAALKDHFFGENWLKWPDELKNRTPSALEFWKERLKNEILYQKFLQFLFFSQWMELKNYMKENFVQIIGDAPIYVTLDSADVWANRALFLLNEDGQPNVVAGVPPDYFSPTGQRWGNPIYNWAAHKKDGFAWWKARLGHNAELFDLTRLDHFRGFVGYWEILAEEETAKNGRWVKGPGKDFLAAMQEEFPKLPIIAEDLGVITPDVRALMEEFRLSGMRVLQFGFSFDMPQSTNITHNFPQNCVAYTGTHDNNTTRGWFCHDAGEENRKRFFAYLGKEFGEESAAWEMIRLAMLSHAWLTVLPMQDLIALGSWARMNTPSIAQGNWVWRVEKWAINNELAWALRDLTALYGRDRLNRVYFKKPDKGRLNQ